MSGLGLSADYSKAAIFIGLPRKGDKTLIQIGDHERRLRKVADVASALRSMMLGIVSSRA
jgi:hypothetical protein